MKIDDVSIDALVSEIGGAPQEDLAPNQHRRKINADWEPPLHPSQRKLFYCNAQYVLADSERGTGKCVQPESFVYTSGKLRRISSLKPAGDDKWLPINEPIVAFDGKNLVPDTACQFYTETSTDARRITFSNGNTILCSPRHPIWGAWEENGVTKFGYKTASELQSAVGFYVPLFAHSQWTNEKLVKVDYLPNRINQEAYRAIRKHDGINRIYEVMRLTGHAYYTIRDHRNISPWSTEICEDVAYLLGVLVGDGGMTSRAVILTCADQEILEAISKGAEKVGARIKQRTEKYSYAILGEKLSALVTALGMRTLSKHKSIPDEIIESPRRVVCAFLRGLFDTDGTAEKQGSIVYCTASEKLAFDVQHLLQALGLFSSRKFKPNSKAGAWLISLYGEDAIAFGKMIGFNVARKAARIRPEPKVTNRNENGYAPFITREMRRLRKEWHEEHRSILACRNVPSPHKLARFKELCGTSENLEKLSISSRWVMVSNVSPARSNLVDLSVPVNRSFIANGLINHNTSTALHKLVRHCVRNRNALAFIVVREIGNAVEGGAFSKLVNEILPQWAHGAVNRKTGKRINKGAGIEYTQPKLDFSDKKPVIWLTNRHGGWSQIKLLSLFVAGQLADKARGKEPSFCLVDEAQTMEGDAYFSQLGMQVGRRQDIEDVQQIVYCANPKGESHWLWKTFWLHGADDEGQPIQCAFDDETGHPIDPVTDKPITEFARFHIPISENISNLPPGYWDRVVRACKNDPIEYQRMVLGQWVDKPEGDALFRDEWKDALHLQGDLRKAQGIIPQPGHMFVIGWDPGSAHTAIAMLQFFANTEQTLWVQFDEMNFVGKYMPYRKLVPKLIDELVYWENLASEFALKNVEFKFIHISDNSAFNQFRAKDGSFDAQDIEDISKVYVASRGLPERFVIKMRECPKGPHSVEARVREARDLLATQSFVLSAICQGTRDAFMNLEEDPKDRMKPKRSQHVHPFDATTYPIHYFQSGLGRGAKQIPKLEPTQFYVVGKGGK